jgi:hypothetical protein
MALRQETILEIPIFELNVHFKFFANIFTDIAKNCPT